MTSPADRAHLLLSGEIGGGYYRFRAAHDLLGHVATGYRFDRDGEYSAWLVQRTLYTGLARWAAATELHGHISCAKIGAAVCGRVRRTELPHSRHGR